MEFSRDFFLIRKTILAAATILVSNHHSANAETLGIEAEIGFSTMLVDRSETLAMFNNDLLVQVSQEMSLGKIYGGMYVIRPLGNGRDAFEDEVDFSLGYEFMANEASINLSINYLTFPKTSEDNTTEFVAEASMPIVTNPQLIAFHDIEQDTFGVEALITPYEVAGLWQFYTQVRGGFVSSPDGDYSYAGVENTVGRELGDGLALEAFARFDIADESTFVSQIRDAQIIDRESTGLSAGIRLKVQR